MRIMESCWIYRDPLIKTGGAGSRACSLKSRFPGLSLVMSLRRRNPNPLFIAQTGIRSVRRDFYHTPVHELVPGQIIHE